MLLLALAVRILKKFVKSGVHRIRIDLENIPIYEKIIIQPPLPTPEISTKREYTVQYDGLNSANNPIGRRLSGNKKILRLLDGDGNDTNASFRIVSTSPGLRAKFSDDASKLIVSGQSKGDVTLRLKWDDNPRTAGVAVKNIKIDDVTQNFSTLC